MSKINKKHIVLNNIIITLPNKTINGRIYPEDFLVKELNKYKLKLLKSQRVKKIKYLNEKYRN